MNSTARTALRASLQRSAHPGENLTESPAWGRAVFPRTHLAASIIEQGPGWSADYRPAVSVQYHGTGIPTSAMASLFRGRPGHDRLGKLSREPYFPGAFPGVGMDYQHATQTQQDIK